MAPSYPVHLRDGSIILLFDTLWLTLQPRSRHTFQQGCVFRPLGQMYEAQQAIAVWTHYWHHGRALWRGCPRGRSYFFKLGQEWPFIGSRQPFKNCLTFSQANQQAKASSGISSLLPGKTSSKKKKRVLKVVFCVSGAWTSRRRIRIAWVY